MCGEKLIYFGALSKPRGSPPRVRGKAGKSNFPLCGARITPACAGKRGLQLSGKMKKGDHPRVCGEKLTIKGKNWPVVGSPPRVRGKGIFNRYLFAAARITPACAGKSAPMVIGICRHRDHPRVCGEKAPSIHPALAETGSPPRVRGKATPLRERRNFDGITPACAGKSPAASGF